MRVWKPDIDREEQPDIGLCAVVSEPRSSFEEVAPDPDENSPPRATTTAVCVENFGSDPLSSDERKRVEPDAYLEDEG